MAKKNKRKSLPKKAKRTVMNAVDKFGDVADTFRASTKDLIDAISKTFFVIVFVLFALIAIFSYITYKLIVLSPEPGALITVSLVVLVVIILALIVGAYKVFKWWVVSRFLKGLTNLI